MRWLRNKPMMIPTARCYLFSFTVIGGKASEDLAKRIVGKLKEELAHVFPAVKSIFEVSE